MSRHCSANTSLLLGGAARKGIPRRLSVGITSFQVLDYKGNGGEGGIRTLGTGVSPYNGLANRRIRPLCHLSGDAEIKFTTVRAALSGGQNQEPAPATVRVQG